MAWVSKGGGTRVVPRPALVAKLPPNWRVLPLRKVTAPVGGAEASVGGDVEQGPAEIVVRWWWH